MAKKGETFLELNLEDAVSFFNHAQELIKEYIESSEDDDEIRYKQIGDIVENLLKYIITLHQFREYNGKLKGHLYDYEEIDELLEKEIITPKMHEDLKKYNEGEFEDFNLSKYAFLYKLIDLMFYENTFDIIYKTLKNQIATSLGKKKYLDNEDMNIYDRFMLITNSFNKVNLKELLNEEGKGEYKALVSEVKNKRTGIQDRYRMFAGNLSNPKTDIYGYEVEDLFSLVLVLNKYCKYIHNNNDDFNFNYIETFYWENVDKMKSLINRSEEEIRLIKSITKYRKDTLLSSYLFQSSISADDIFGYSKLDELNNKDLEFMFVNNVSFDTYSKLREKGFSIDEVIKIVTLNGNEYDNYKVNENRFDLLPYLKIPIINGIDDNVSNYFLNKKKELMKLFDNKNYEEYFSAFITLFQKEEVNGLFEILENLDFEQLKIYDNLDKYLRKNEKLSCDDIIENVISNIKMFNEDTDILSKIPIMLDAVNNKEIYNALLDNGLEEDKIEYIDGTIFCYNNKYVIKVFNILKEKEIDVLINDKLNPNIIRYVTQMIHKETTNKLAPMIMYRPNKHIEQNEI
ncbi:MAG: hypothetical protein IKR57_04935 [Bacilli bacterium]|nr:hypothetical protein [Bacilli bacterium]